MTISQMLSAVDCRMESELIAHPAWGQSLEGPETIHDNIRGKKSFQLAIRGLTHLLSQNLSVTLNLTLSALNVDSIEEMASLASSLGVQRIGFSRLVPSGRGQGLIDSMLSKERLREAYEKIHSMNISKCNCLHKPLI